MYYIIIFYNNILYIYNQSSDKKFFIMDFEVVGSIKIKDGLFLGDEYAAQVHTTL